MKVLLVVIDAATPRVVIPAIQTGQLPTLQRLVEAGQLRESITMFPSITPAATTTIITGAYPKTSGIVGASWYEEDSEDVAYFGDDFWIMVREGFRAFLRDFLVGLNGNRLKAPTLFERVENAGKQAMCLNYLIFKGNVEHKVKMPLLLAMLPGVSSTEIVQGPSALCIGDFVATRDLRGKPLVDKSGAFHRFGMDDASTGELLCEVAEDDAFADFSVAYFADNDYRSHKVGPAAALEVIECVDAALGRMFEAAGGMDAMLQDTFVIITSDHGHCEILADEERAVIRLDQALGEFRQAALGKPWSEGDEIMICPNMRAAQIYFHGGADTRIEEAIAACLRDERVDHVAWRTGGERGGASTDRRRAGNGEAGPGGNGAAGEMTGGSYAVESRQGRLRFWRGSEHQGVPGAGSASDAYGCAWNWDGDLAVVDAEVTDGQLRWKDYPNAFERLAGALDAPNGAPLWVTAIPGCEFEVPGGSAHVGGGSHGGLHALESWCPLIIAGPRPVELPDQTRSVDLAPLILGLLEIPSELSVGRAH